MIRRCPQCQQTYSDEIFYCLSDGTPLDVVFNATEQVTVVKNEEATVIRQSPFVQSPPQAEQRGISRIFAYLAFGLLVLVVAGLLAGGVIVWQLKSKPDVSSTGNSNTANKSNAANISSNYIEPTPNKEQNSISQQKANLQDQQSQLEKEKQKLAEDRKKLEAKKDNPPEKPYTPVSQPTARINFQRGSMQSKTSGTVASERSYVLRARSGQYLSASVSSGNGCVVFNNGSTSISYTTSNGDNRISVTNKCGGQSSFSLTVSIR